MRQQLEQSTPDDIKELLKENNKLAKEALEIAKKTRRSLRLMHWTNTAKFLLVLIPLVGALIFLPPIIQQLDKQFSAMTGGAGIFDVLKSLPTLIGGGTKASSLPSLPKNIDPKLVQDFLKQHGIKP